VAGGPSARSRFFRPIEAAPAEGIRIWIVAHLSFFDGLIKRTSELAIHDYVDELTKRTRHPRWFLPWKRRPASSDTSLVLSAYLERLSIAIAGVVGAAKDAQAKATQRADRAVPVGRLRRPTGSSGSFG